ncbi:MAG: restriction endonuclease subunit S [Anaerolineales bacterium]|nr:restriction endonuclease subunit S [Anaerolineales bacterium]
MSTLSYLEKLLDGVAVEWKALGTISTIRTGQSVNKKMISDNPGEYPVINSGREPLGFVNVWNTVNDPIGVTTRGAGVGSITWQDGKYFRGNLNYSVTIKRNQKVTNRYLYHLLLNMQPDIQSLCTYDGIPALNAGNLKKLQIPIPCPDNPAKSLAIQADIVRILDTFTELTAELTAALTAELTARQTQYAYYRDQLLHFEEGEVEWKRLGEVAILRRGRVISKKYLVDNAGDYPVYSSQTTDNGTMGKIDTFDFDGEFISWTTDGANAGTVFHRTGKFSITNVCGVIKISDVSTLNYKFLFYWLSIEAQRHVYFGMGNPKLMSNQVEKIPVPIPYANDPKKSLAEQARIVAILDKFDALTNSISEGLPREIALRQQQYEYYRDLLFSFPKPDEA